jgi:hypothetical protein
MDLYNIIYVNLHAFPKDIINLIMNYVTILNNKYKYSINNPGYCDNICFNKELGIIYCSSQNFYKLIDYKNGTRHDSSLIDLRSFETQLVDRWWHTIGRKIIYFGNDTIICYRNYNDEHSKFDKYTLTNKKYEHVSDKFMRSCVAAYVYEQQIYVYAHHGHDKYYILVYDWNFHVINCSAKIIQENTNLQMSIHNDTIYIIESWYKNACYIHEHDIKTLYRYVTRIFIHGSYDNIIIYKDNIYVCEPNKIIVYDIILFEPLYTIDIKFNPKNRISISNGLTIVSNKKEIMVYDTKK